MKHKIIYGAIGSLIVGAAVAIPLSITLTDHKTDLSDDERKLRSLDTQISDTQLEIRLATERYNILSEDIAEKRVEYEKIQQDLANQRDAEQQILDQISSVNEEIRLLQEQKDPLIQEITQIENTLSARASARQRLDDANTNNWLVKFSPTATQPEKDAALSEYTQAKDAYDALTVDQPTNAELQRRLNDLKTQLEELTMQQTALNDRIAEEHDKYVQIQEQADEVQKQIAAKEAELNGLTSTINTLSADSQALNSERDNLRVQLGQRDQVIVDTQNELTMYRQIFEVVPTTPGYEGIVMINYAAMGDANNPLNAKYIELRRNISRLTSFVSTDMVSLDAPENVGNFFNGMTNIEELYLPKAFSIGNNAFKNSTKLKTIFIPVATTIGDNAFAKIPNDPSTNIYLPSKFNTYTEKKRIFGERRNDQGVIMSYNMTFHWT